NQVPVATSSLDPRFLLAASLLAIGAVALLRARRRVPIVVLGLLLAGSTLALTANVFVTIGTIKAERLLYLPSFGWCLAVGCLAERFVAPDRRRMIVVALALVLLGGRTWARNRDWHDEFTLFTATARASPDSARAQSNAAAVYGQRGDLAR